MPMNPADLDLICDLVKARSGIDLTSSKEYLVEARMIPLARKLGIATTTDLAAKLRQRGNTIERDVVDAMTTNETSFFRDGSPFEVLKKTVIPELIARRAATRRLNIWCAASSTGQEPYTIAMLLRENFPMIKNWDIKFIASDLSRDVLARAKAGRFSQLEVNRGLPATLMVKYFKKIGLEWEISSELRSMIDFREMNLVESWPAMPPMDVVFIRNVLIYFTQDTKKQIVQKIHNLMQPDGYLFLGVAETPMAVDDRFERAADSKGGCYQRKNAVQKLAA